MPILLKRDWNDQEIVNVISFNDKHSLLNLY